MIPFRVQLGRARSCPTTITYPSLPPSHSLHPRSNTVISPLLHPLRIIGQPLDLVHHALSFVLPPSIIPAPRQRGPSLLRQTCFYVPSPHSLSHPLLPHILTQSLRSDIIPGLPLILLRFNAQGRGGRLCIASRPRFVIRRFHHGFSECDARTCEYARTTIIALKPKGYIRLIDLVQTLFPTKNSMTI